MIVGGIPLLLGGAGGGGGGAGGGDITAGITYSNKSVDTSAKDGTMRNPVFSLDGTKMLMTGDGGNDINLYTLSVAWDLSTASHITQTSVSAQTGSPRAMAIKPDGTKLFVADINGAIFRYSMNPAWDVSTLSYDTHTFDLTKQAVGVFISGDGTKFFNNNTGGLVDAWTMSTPFDLTTLTEDGTTFDFGVASNFSNLGFSADGLRMYICEMSDGLIYQANLTVAWDIGTATLIGTVDPVQGGNSYSGIWVNLSNNRLLISDISSDEVYQFTFDDLS